MCETANNVQKSFKVDYEVSVVRPYELCGPKIVLCFYLVRLERGIGNRQKRLFLESWHLTINADALN